MRLERTSEGKIWAGGSFLGRLARRGSRLEIENHRLDTNPVRNVLSVRYEEHTRKLWACYNGGLVARSEDGSWREITTKDGLLVNGCWGLAPLPNGDVWDTYFGLGAVALIRPGPGGHFAIRQYGPKEGIPEPGGDAMEADQQGRLWRSGDLGTYVADAVEAEAGSWLTLNTSDGIPANGINSGSFFADPDGSLWWGADNDVVHYSPSPDLTKPRLASKVFLSAFSWNGGTPKLAEAVEGLPHGSRITAHIGSLQFDRRNNLRLRYRILPDQPSWRESSSLDLTLGQLPSGRHTLEVQARIFTGPWSGTASHTITVFKPIWLTWPMLVGFTLATGALVATGGRWRMKSKERAKKLLPELSEWRLTALSPELQQLEGAVLDSRFEVGRVLARGGFATIVEGRDLRRDGRPCAVKIFRQELTDKEWVLKHFQQEVLALEKIEHPNVVRIYGHGATPRGAPYLVMERITGKTLREVLEQGRLAKPQIASYLRQVGSALNEIHTHGIFHRDLKPENLMIRDALDPGQELVLIDFSIAIVQDPDETVHGLSRAAGTILYMAPEHALGYADSRTDIYSLAKILIEMLTGQRLSVLLPDASLDLPQRVRHFLKGMPLPLSWDSIQLLSSALEFDPSRRPKNAAEFATRIANDMDTPQARA